MTDSAALQKEGRSFNCQTCPESVKALRRCREDREDFAAADGAIWPMYIHKGGQLYDFCPAKATWDFGLQALFQELIVMAETKCLPYAGGLYDQPTWVVETLAWFLPTYDFMKFLKKADMILGGSSDKKNNLPAPAPRQQRGR